MIGAESIREEDTEKEILLRNNCLYDRNFNSAAEYDDVRHVTSSESVFNLGQRKCTKVAPSS